MSHYLDQVNKSLGNGDVLSSSMAEHVEQWPNMVQAFVGRKNELGHWEPGPATLMIFLEGDQMKFCLSPKYTTKVCFGCISDPSMILDSVEQALTTGKCEWKLRGGKK